MEFGALQVLKVDFDMVDLTQTNVEFSISSSVLRAAPFLDAK
ncbi:MAG TPA: hypothetical protein PKL52_01580 [Tenuifilaceae bacterium]|nr:hypothetical protein [Tenuifilaceae bacterium]